MWSTGQYIALHGFPDVFLELDTHKHEMEFSPGSQVDDRVTFIDEFCP